MAAAATTTATRTRREIVTALRLTLVLAAITGLAYPLAMTGIAQVAFNDQANGSLISRNGGVVGSRLIGQNFTDAKYFHGRPSATVSETDSTKAAPYNAQNSAGSNLAPSNQALIDRIKKQIADLRKTEPGLGPLVPVDMVTTDFSGFDPDISEASALVQVQRVAQARGLTAAAVTNLVESSVEGPSLGIFGESHVNVLKLNLALDDGAAH
ncbi:MAG TPA: potassium-transporting ATPase subunit KdpC [Candidatus Solibacter sp.]|jgi:K+-transporting ATPase ATPase C chain|nr:potassium-transporting ATPase subunit KdpC [Candidatus Solibacter sp.]